MTSVDKRQRIRAELQRAAEGRWLAGVCAGLARARGRHVGWIRGAFGLAILAGALGALAYVACWLILPAEGDEADRGDRAGIVVLARVCAAGLGVAALGTVAATATVFGFGGIVLAAAAAILAGMLMARRRVGPAWALLPVSALALPALAVATVDLRLEPSNAPSVVAPRTFVDVPDRGYRSGLGTLRVDLRRTMFPATGSVSLKIGAGARRTIVALPHDRCVHVVVRSDHYPYVGRVAGMLTDRSTNPHTSMFGEWLVGYGTVQARRGRRTRGPTLNIDFASGGGSLYVRDYPVAVDPDRVPDWPGQRVFPEERPGITGTPKRGARKLIRGWRKRHREQVRSARRVNPAIAGPCVKRRSRT